MATLKTATGRLYMLFNACLPQNEKVNKRFNICKMLESVEYNELKNYTPFASQFEKYFSAEKLMEYDDEKLEEIKIVIPKIIPLIEKLNNSITYGNALELTEKDMPDFTSIKSIDDLSDKIKIDQTEPNVTNITKDNFLSIFSSKTVKDPTEVLKSISVDEVDSPTEAVKNKLAKSIYCIKAKDIADIQNKYAEDMAEIKSKFAGLNEDKWKMRYKKWIYIAVAIVLLVVINSFELMTADVLSTLTGLSALLLLVYFFVG